MAFGLPLIDTVAPQVPAGPGPLDAFANQLTEHTDPRLSLMINPCPPGWHLENTGGQWMCVPDNPEQMMGQLQNPIGLNNSIGASRGSDPRQNTTSDISRTP